MAEADKQAEKTVVNVPAPPDSEGCEAALADDQIDQVAGGGSVVSHGTPGTGLMFGPYFDSATNQMQSQP